jgi:hypothetical protein
MSSIGALSLRVPVLSPIVISLDFPLITLYQHHQQEEAVPHLHTEDSKSKP